MKSITTMTVFLGSALVFSGMGCSNATSMRDQLVASCLEKGGTSSRSAESIEQTRELCECMADDLVSSTDVPDDVRTRLAADWNGGIEITNGARLNEEQGAIFGFSMRAWGRCAKKLDPNGIGAQIKVN